MACHCFTTLCWVLLYNKVNQLCVYVCPLPRGPPPPPIPPLEAIAGHELSSLCFSAFSLVTYFTMVVHIHQRCSLFRPTLRPHCVCMFALHLNSSCQLLSLAQAWHVSLWMPSPCLDLVLSLWVTKFCGPFRLIFTFFSTVKVGFLLIFLLLKNETLPSCVRGPRWVTPPVLARQDGDHVHELFYSRSSWWGTRN